MIQNITRLGRPSGLFGLASLTTLAGLGVRSCHEAGEALSIPLCSGQTMMLETGGSAIIHCAGCYAALFGMIAMVGSLIWAGVRRAF